MAQLTIELPDDLARQIENIAGGQNKSVQDFVLDGLRSRIPVKGSPAAILAALQRARGVDLSIVDRMESIIRESRVSSSSSVRFDPVDPA